MITKEKFVEIRNEVSAAIEEAFDRAAKCGINGYSLFLVLAEYQASLEGTNMSPYIIEYQIDKYKDYSRQKFLVDFLNKYYSFPDKQTTDEDYKLTLELLVYSHIWESKPFLKSLKRLTELVVGNDYLWNVEIPDMGKHDFIRTSIRDELKKANCKLEDVITKGYHSSLRNAFAHSDYSIDSRSKIIHLDNYKGENWALENISFDDWSIRFIYSFLISYCLGEIFYRRRGELNTYVQSEQIKINIPDRNKKIIEVRLRYNPERDSFHNA